MVIKSHALELRGYKESRITIHTHIHNKGEKSHTTLNSIINSLVTPPPT